MADNPPLAIPRNARSMMKADQKTRVPISLAQLVKMVLGITTWSELTKGDEAYFGY